MAEISPFPPMHAEDLPYLAPDEGCCELIAGELVREPPPGQGHGSVAGAVLVHVGRFVLEHGLGKIYAAETGFVLARDPDTVRCPDAAFVSAERLAEAGGQGLYFEGAPDLAIEVLSPGNTPREIEQKIREYLAAGGRAVWVLDTTWRTVTVHTPDAGRRPRTYGPGDTVAGAPVLPGLSVRVAELF
jgi:Uma2 family endonuclease